MPKLTEDEYENTLDVLVEFWLQGMKDAPDYTDKLKCSEFIAKYVLEAGRQKVKKVGSSKPSTAEVLKYLSELEEKTGINGEE